MIVRLSSKRDEPKRDEQAIREFNTRLTRVAERTAELVQVNRQLQQEIEQRQQAENQERNLLHLIDRLWQSRDRASFSLTSGQAHSA